MRRTILSATVVAVTAVLAVTAPAVADGRAPSPAPSSRTASPEPTRAATPVPTAAPAEAGVRDRSAVSEPTRAAAGDQVRAVPAGAPDTGVTTPSSDSRDGLIGGDAAGLAVVLAGGAVLVVRRRATGA
ncbi:sortase-dependent protein [Streptomyces nodosus]|uniref:sortase-dependent protein n=1 Tax=Streptomyces nodosus TaxID=40318 RepID=UPI00382EBA5E